MIARHAEDAAETVAPIWSNDLMADEGRVRAWIDGHVRAWNSNDSADIAALFTDDAEYHTEPFRDPWRGRAAIVDGWLGRRTRWARPRSTGKWS